MQGSAPSKSGGGLIFKAYDGEYRTEQVRCDDYIAEELKHMSQVNSIIKVDKASLLKGFILVIEKYSIVKVAIS